MENDERIIKCKCCKDCGTEFDISKDELDRLRRKFGKDFSEPVRCKACRAKKKERKR